jgi:hypothetical protein
VTLDPESTFSVHVADDVLICRHSDGTIQSVALSAISRVLVETNDAGPWGMDVWWIVEGRSAREWCSFPQGATGEDEILTWLKRLPGFEVRGMNCTDNRRFECWPNPEP